MILPAGRLPGQANPLWYKDAIIYETHVRAFYDSTDDGVGDFRGLTEKLDYLQSLGITAIWVLPFFPSPLKDDGYDIADYTAIHPAYGTLRDFKTFLEEAHRRGLRVIIELVLNHTSDQHGWFQRARRATPGSAARDFYVWSDTAEKYQEARIIFQDFETSNWAWDSEANAYYWHRFYSHQPDLNYDNPQVREAIFNAVDFWLEMGVDGLRLDAVPYLFERAGTDCENLPETHAFLKELRRHIDERFPARMLLAEANQWPEDAVAYFGDGDECHMAFHFPLMPRLFMALRMEDRFPIIDILAQTPAIPDNTQWALFLRNHDELTLKMVTEEERFYMYRVYASSPEARVNLGIRRRLAPLMGNNRREIELMNGLLFSLPGTPVVYYGDEIGMGDNIYLGVRNGVRTPMQWSVDRNGGFSRANPQQLYLPLITDYAYHHETINVEAQQQNPHSLLWWMKRLIAARKRHKAFGRGSFELLHPENRKVLAFIRRYEDEQILVVANLSQFLQHVQLDLTAFRGQQPVEVNSRTRLPLIGESLYPLTLAPHAFHWFSVEPQPVSEVSAAGSQEPEVPVITVTETWEDIVYGDARAALEEALPAYLRRYRWFSGKTLPILSTRIVDHVQIPCDTGTVYLLMLQVTHTEGESRTYAVPVARAAGDAAISLLSTHAHAVIARLHHQGADRFEEVVVYDALWAGSFAAALLQAISGGHHFDGSLGRATATPTTASQRLPGSEAMATETTVLQAAHNNTSVAFGDQLILKLFRRIYEGLNPEVEIGSFLTVKGFAHTPPHLGTIEYRRHRGEPMTLAILQGFIPNKGTAWDYTQAALRDYFTRASATHAQAQSASFSTRILLDLAEQTPPSLARELIGSYLGSARCLGQRTAELHVMLSSEAANADFAPQPFTSFYQRARYQSLRGLTVRVFDQLRRELPETVGDEAQRVLELEQAVLDRFRQIRDRPIGAMRTRYHGDYHLGQVLYTGDDFVIFDFEGNPDRPLVQRRLKHSPLLDVASMLRSFQYATYVARFERLTDATRDRQTVMALENWARFWSSWVSAAFLDGYFATAAQASFVPPERGDIGILLDIFLLQRTIFELSYELTDRPDWVRIPLQGLLQLMETDR